MQTDAVEWTPQDYAERYSMDQEARIEAGRALEVGRVIMALDKLRGELIAGGAIPADVAFAVVDCAEKDGVTMPGQEVVN